jgi:hypothetical protein
MRSVLLGSVSSQVVDASPCPLLIVPRGIHAGDAPGEPARAEAMLGD